MSANWLAVASAEHVRRGREYGFMQVCHGRPAPLRRIQPGDGIVYYSPTTLFGGKDALRAFTAIGTVRGGDPYQADAGSGLRPFRRDVDWAQAQEAPIRPLLERLDLSAGKSGWGISTSPRPACAQQARFPADRGSDGRKGLGSVLAGVMIRPREATEVSLSDGPRRRGPAEASGAFRFRAHSRKFSEAPGKTCFLQVLLTRRSYSCDRNFSFGANSRPAIAATLTSLPWDMAMFSISTDHISVALQILQGSARDDTQAKDVDASVFVASPVFSTSSEFVGAAISEAMKDEGLQQEFEQALEKAWREHPPRMTEDGLQSMSVENAKHLALSEVIRQNRAKFPPQGFMITTQLGDGASISTQVPPIGAARSSPASEPGRKAEGGPSPSNTALARAQSTIVSALVLNSKA